MFNKIVFVLFIVAFVLGLSVQGHAMRVYNKSDRSIYVYVTVGHDEYTETTLIGTKKGLHATIKPGKSKVFKPGNLHPQAARMYSVFVWKSRDDWHFRKDPLGAFFKELYPSLKVIDGWLIPSIYSSREKWPKGLLMIAEKFDDDGFYLIYRGEDRPPKKGGCSCPKGYWRSGKGCKSKKACSKEISEKFEKATYHGKKQKCKSGEFYDPRKGGECWECPKGYNRTLYPVTHKKACSKPGYEKFKKAKKKKKASRGKCPKGQFLHLWNGYCYSCGGYNRTTYPIDHKRACSKWVKEDLKPATFKRKVPCESGQFYDPRKGGECWSCPKGTNRTIHPVNSNKACLRPKKEVFTEEEEFVRDLKTY